jgi:hypothetical protein
MVVSSVLLVGGCGRTMSESDCEKIGNHLREVWDNDIKATAPNANDDVSEVGAVILKGHRGKIGDEWLNQCRRELEGRRVDKRELDCVLKAGTIADVQGCASRAAE